MADFNISGRMKVSTLKKNFKSNFKSTLRVYNGKKFAEDDDTVSKIAKKTIKQGSEVAAHGRTKIGNFEKAMKDTFGINVQVANTDDSVLLDDDISLAQSGNQ